MNELRDIVAAKIAHNYVAFTDEQAARIKSDSVDDAEAALAVLAPILDAAVRGDWMFELRANQPDLYEALQAWWKAQP